jgi:hypothetical protein
MTITEICKSSQTCGALHKCKYCGLWYTLSEVNLTFHICREEFKDE